MWLQEKLNKKRLKIGYDTDRDASDHMDIGDIHRAHGMYKEAEDSYFEGLRIFEALYGDNHEEIGHCYNRLSNLFSTLGLHKESDKLRKAELRICLIFNDEISVNVAVTLINMAESLFVQHLPQDALVQYQQALNIYVQVVGRDQPCVSLVLSRLSTIYLDVGLMDKAKEAAQEAHDIANRHCEYYSQEVMSSLVVMGDIHEADGRFDDALAANDKALAICQRLHGDKHPRVAAIICSIACIYAQQGRWDDALKVYTKALKLQVKTLGQDHEVVGGSNLCVGRGYFRQSMFQQALEHFQEANRILTLCYGIQHERIATSCFWLGASYANLQNIDEALKYLQNAHRIYTTLGISNSISERSVVLLDTLTLALIGLQTNDV
jgi:tetratricopeptide (TPR) repeat protein